MANVNDYSADIITVAAACGRENSNNGNVLWPVM